MLVVRQRENYSSLVWTLPAPGLPCCDLTTNTSSNLPQVSQLVKTGAGNFDDVLLHRQFVVYPHAKVPDNIDRLYRLSAHSQSEIILLQLG